MKQKKNLPKPPAPEPVRQVDDEDSIQPAPRGVSYENVATQPDRVIAPIKTRSGETFTYEDVKDQPVQIKEASTRVRQSNIDIENQVSRENKLTIDTLNKSNNTTTLISKESIQKGGKSEWITVNKIRYAIAGVSGKLTLFKSWRNWGWSFRLRLDLARRSATLYRRLGG